jgi:hypothetical protein
MPHHNLPQGPPGALIFAAFTDEAFSSLSEANRLAAYADLRSSAHALRMQLQQETDRCATVINFLRPAIAASSQDTAASKEAAEQLLQCPAGSPIPDSLMKKIANLSYVAFPKLNYNPGRAASQTRLCELDERTRHRTVKVSIVFLRSLSETRCPC